MSAKPKRGRPSNDATGRSSRYVHAPASEVAAWEIEAKRAEQTSNGWARAVLNAAVEAARSKR